MTVNTSAAGVIVVTFQNKTPHIYQLISHVEQKLASSSVFWQLSSSLERIV